MSWDAYLYEVAEVKNCPECGHKLGKPRVEESGIGDWNYTGNTSPMIYDVLRTGGAILEDTWWKHFDGMTGKEGQVLLTTIIAGLEADPDKYRAMNPPNGWGNYDGLLGVLREMRDAVPADAASRWSVSG